MKKLFFFAIVMLMASSCTCLIAQIPPQYVYVTTSCEATLPDYLPMVTVSDNCQIKSVTQNPLPGFTLNATNPQVTVTIRATDVFDNFTEISFSVKAVDTVPPIIIPTGDLLTDNWQKIHGLYDAADRLLAEQEQYFDLNFDWDAAGIPEDKRPTGQYDKKVLTILTSPAHATKGYGGRFIMYQSNNDSFVAK